MPRKYNKLETRDRALYYLDKHPGLSNYQVNKMLQTDYPGARITDSVLAMLRKERVRPYFHTLVVSGNEIDILKGEGFTVKEAKRIMEGVKVSLDDPAMVAYRKSRINWWVDKLRLGWTAGQVRRAIARMQKTVEVDPWVEFRQEYLPTPRRKTLAEYRSALAKHKKALNIPKPMYHLLRFKPRQPVTVTVKGERITF